MILNKKLFMVYFFLFIWQLSFCQSREKGTLDTLKTNYLQEAIVTATRTERQLATLPLPAQIVAKKEIQAVNSLRLADILSEQTGLNIVQDHGQGIQVQGLSSDYVLILIDGVPLVGRTAGTFDLSRITVGNIKQIEIVKGASSSLYGSEAMGGVINIITKKPKEGVQGDFGYRGSSFNITDVNASVNAKMNKLGASFFVNRYSSDGYDLNKEDELKTQDPFYNYTLSAKGTYDVSENTQVNLSGRFFIENQQSIPTLELSGENEAREWNAHLQVNHKFNSKWKGYLDFYTTRYITNGYLDNTDGSRFSDSDYNQFMIRPEIRIGYDVSKKQSIIGGVGWTKESLDRTFFSNTPVYNAPYIYAQYDANISEKLNVILGFRYDMHSEYNNQFSPKFAVRYAITDQIIVKGSVGYGYKAPDFRQLFLDFTNPTAGYTVIGYNLVQQRIPELDSEGQITNVTIPLNAFGEALSAENSINYNLGFRVQAFSNFTIDTNVFRNDINDLIDTKIIARKTNGQNVFSYLNVSKVYTQGVELNLAWKPNQQLRITGGYQLLFAKDKDAEKAFKNGEVFARDEITLNTFRLDESDYVGLYNRSRHMANGKVFYTIPKWKINMNIRGTYRSKYGINDTNGNGYLDSYDSQVKGYTIWDFAINKTLFKNYTVSLGADNVFDYTDSENINSLAGQIIYGKLNIHF